MGRARLGKEDGTTRRFTRGRGALLPFVMHAIVLAACTPLEPVPDPGPRLDQMNTELRSLQDAIADSEMELARLQLEQQDLVTVVNAHESSA